MEQQPSVISAGSVSAESVEAIRTDELGCRTVHARAPDQLATRHACGAAAIPSAARAVAAAATTRAHPILLRRRSCELGRHRHEFIISIQRAAARVVRYETCRIGAGLHQAEMSGAAISRRLEHDFSDRDALAGRRSRAARVAHVRRARPRRGGGRAPLGPRRLVGVLFWLGPEPTLERPVGIGEPARALLPRATARRLGNRFTPVCGQPSAAGQRERAGDP